ncbi:MAG: DNA translocase FtsK [Candidatus Izemoplasmatales bacterium]|nr:DNA translocase FtsK [Candidatus Izemoplasmatales bacterium]
MMCLFKKKITLERIIPGYERTEDKREFFIPKISELEDKETSKQKFVSPIFGKHVKDEVVVPLERSSSGDIDKKYDAFRKHKKLTKEEAKLRYGDSYYDFNTIRNADKQKILAGEMDTDYLATKKAEAEKQNDPSLQPSHNVPETDQVSINDFFETVRQNDKPIISTEPNTINFDDDFELSHQHSGDLDVNRFGPVDEEEEASPLFGFNETKPILSREETVKDHLSDPVDTFDENDINRPDDERLELLRNQIITNFDNYVLPPVAILKKSAPRSSDVPSWIQKNIDIINQTMLSFDIIGDVSSFTKGPTVTRYEISLGAGVPTKKITAISDNFQMNLAAHSIRIEAPIPGKTTIGIEVPNEVRESVCFGDVVDNAKFLQSKDPLIVAIGLDIDANPVYTSLETMPHGLVAGSTQSGKSVCIASIIASILYKDKPDIVKLLLIDPKKVDLQQFADIPHLVTPIIDDTKTAIEALKWTCSEMERRYDVLKRFKAVNVKDYYERRIHDIEFEKMPRLVIIVEEASDLLINGGPEVEETILRLTQKSRAVGIHLILATQRPSADILKGAIKANIPTRFAFKVPSTTDSMVVLDTTGAEKLLGRGDMLLSENGLIRRLQGVFLSPNEIETITNFIKKQAYPQYMFTHDTLIKASKTVDEGAELDELFPVVAKYVVNEEKCSLNKITQEFGIGFNRATQIVSSLELYGIVSRNVGTKPREVLISDMRLHEILEKLGVN